jgi:uncharacterized membrane protein
VTEPGLGFVIVLASVLLVGWIGSFFLMRRLFVLFDRWLKYTPGVSFLYFSIRVHRGEKPLHPGCARKCFC